MLLFTVDKGFRQPDLLMSPYSLITILADGRTHHVTELANAVGLPTHRLNALWQQTPPHIRGLLRQRDGMWHLVRPLAWLPETYHHAHFQATVLPHTSSSNDELLTQIRNGGDIHQSLVIALSQSQGRGRQGRIWENRCGECLMFSLGWTFEQEQAQLGALAAVVALACQQALVELGCAAQIKWPNDLVCGLSKLGGILIETVRQDGQTHVVIGIGINFVLPKTVDKAASFQAAVKQKISAQRLMDTLLNHLYTTLNAFATQGFTPFQAAYQMAHRDHNQEIVLLRDGKIVGAGQVCGIADDGALLLQTENGGIEKVFSGETSLRLPEQLAAMTVKLPEKTQHHYLLLDGGNSRLKWAWIENGEIVRTNHAPYRDLSLLLAEWQQYGANVVRITGSAVCNEQKKELVEQCIGQKIEWLSSMPRALGMTNHYRNPVEHGADRWFNALGSRRFSQNACVVVSCGTAVTIDAITADKHYLGGSIMPGFHLMRESLAQKTANLQRQEGLRYPFPTTTANAIATGMMDAVCGALMLMHARLHNRVHNNTVDVVITGGGAAKVAASLPEYFTLNNSIKIVDNLVIHGLLEWIEQEENIKNHEK
ncbi:MAG: biotin--[acetyl-CoA-carboxylase] ligase [Alysiella sp.]|uniref:biotin--[acetyl-CoA-carboxylase] ligase n=1 Tax=Alysiella sp. TaxID=1872483 RepID=UPI0026DBBE40|nr:biotin--[acetyl-CoA-carboxylase] ligase [Alysiella sp.]MDO4433474.1 biotin--[acetyl-CoA-carboxylase] ligase [Alysiella sp.]